MTGNHEEAAASGDIVELILDDHDTFRRQFSAPDDAPDEVFHGWSQAGMTGVLDASPHDALTLGADVERYPHAVAAAVDTLRRSGIGGPYALAIGSEGYTRIAGATEGGHLLSTHLTRILGGDIVRTPGLTGAVVLTGAAVTSCWTSGRTSRSATARTTPTRCRRTWRSRSRSGSPNRTPPSH